MYTEHNQTKKNKKALLLLLVLGVFGFVAFKYTKVKDIVANEDNTKAAVCGTEVVDNSPKSNDIFFSITGNGVVSEIVPEKIDANSVLGTSTSCALGNNKYTGSTSCSLNVNKTSTSVNGKGFISASTEIVMSYIAAPEYLLSGGRSPENSNRKLDLKSYYYKPGGEFFDDTQIGVTAPPGSLGDQIKAEILDGTIKKKAYSTRYTIASSGKVGGGDVTINKYAENDCGATCHNVSNSNPDKSNKASSYLESIYFKYPNQPSEEKDVNNNSNIYVEGTCGNTEIVQVEVTNDSVKKCFNVWQRITGFIGDLFPSSDWSKCSEEDADCINTETIAVKMSPMFKDTNSFAKTRNKIAMDPQSATTYQSAYVVTNCEAIVAGKTVPVKCVWDAEYLFHERKAAEFDDVGGSDTPTLQQYIKYLQDESSKRTDPLITM